MPSCEPGRCALLHSTTVNSLPMTCACGAISYAVLGTFIRASLCHQCPLHGVQISELDHTWWHDTALWLLRQRSAGWRCHGRSGRSCCGC